LLLVSHDRAFIDNVVTSTLVFEGEGRVSEYVGGYEDWLRQRPGLSGRSPDPPAGGLASSDTLVRGGGTASGKPAGAGSLSDPPSSPRKASYRERQELLALPGRIASLESEQQRLHAA